MENIYEGIKYIRYLYNKTNYTIKYNFKIYKIIR